jgi:hypothetical protein
LTDIAKPTVDLVDPSWTLKGPEDNLYFQNDQVIGSSFLSRIADLRTSAANSRIGEMMEVADIPVAVVEKWEREGFILHQESAKSIVARLKAENLEAFISTHKTF